VYTHNQSAPTGQKLAPRGIRSKSVKGQSKFTLLLFLYLLKISPLPPLAQEENTPEKEKIKFLLIVRICEMLDNFYSWDKIDNFKDTRIIRLVDFCSVLLPDDQNYLK